MKSPSKNSTPSVEEELDRYNADKIDWHDVHPQLPEYYEVSTSQLVFLFIGLGLVILIIRAALLGLWDGGTQ